MPDKDINIHVKAKDTRQSKRDIDSVARSGKNLGDDVNNAGKKGSDGLDKLSGSAASTQGRFGKLTSSLASWAARLVGITATIALVTKAINVNKQALFEHAEIAERQQKKLLRLQFLGDFFKEKPELRKEVAAYAELGRRPFEDVADAWYNLRSKSGGLSEARQQSILKEALEYGRTDPDAPLGTLVDMFTLYAKKTGEKDANRIQNVMRQTITEAGGSTGQVAQYMPQFLPVGMEGGLTGPQAAGLWAYITTQFAEPAQATTGLRGVFMALQGKGTPESQKLLKQLGVSGDMNFFEKIGQLRSQQQAGKFGLRQAETIAQRENAAALLSLMKDPKAMMRTIGNVVAVDRPDIDLTKTALQQLMGTDELAKLEDESRQLGVTIENIKGTDVRAAKWDILLKKIEAGAKEVGDTEVETALRLWVGEAMGGFGVSPEKAERIFRGLKANIFEPQKNDVIIHNDQSTNYFPAVGPIEKKRVTFDE